ncbi:hypothetical protein [Pseudarthrobacter sp. PvP090]|uniref:hypothetical protein n=1 Tax=Pseudarthrobacter sp. PvP090 TaxID=3156393 RepID=UPI003399859A
MAATGGTHWTVRAALLLAAGAVAAALAGCEVADDVGLSPSGAAASARSFPDPQPSPARDPELVAAETRNLLELETVLDGSPEGLWFGGSGGLGDTSSGGLSASGIVTQAGQYKVTAACVGAPDAHLSVIQGARQGGTLLERNFDCGDVAEALVDLVPGTVSAHLIRYGGSRGTGAVAGVRISVSEPGQ